MENSSPKKAGFFELLSGKDGFVLGLVTGILALGTIGFIVLLIGKFSSSMTAKVPSLPADNTAQAPAPSAPAGKQEFTITRDNNIRGNFDAPVTLVEFSDFQCPYCGRFKPTVDKILATYGDKVRLVYKHFPLDSIHSEARPAAIAAECAKEQKGNEGFFAFHDAFYANQANLGSALYESTAKANGLNLAKFKTCQTDPKIAARIQADFDEGSAKGVEGTPATFVNGELVSGALPFENFKSIIDTALAGK